MTGLALTAASPPVCLVVIVLGAAVIAGGRPMSAAVAAGQRALGDAARRRLARAVHLAIASMGVVWVALGVVGLAVNLLD